jgi:hypothetical protein
MSQKNQRFYQSNETLTGNYASGQSEITNKKLIGHYVHGDYQGSNMALKPNIFEKRAQSHSRPTTSQIESVNVENYLKENQRMSVKHNTMSSGNQNSNLNDCSKNPFQEVSHLEREHKRLQEIVRKR